MKISKKARLFRWIIKTLFLFIFIVPLPQILRGQLVEVRSFFLKEPIAIVPITQSPDSVWISYYGNVNPGLWIVEPFGGLQVLLTGRVETRLLIPTVIAILIFAAIIILLGNVFCSWACPLGTLIDVFDIVVGKFFPKIETKREKRRLKVKQDREKRKQTRVACSICPLHMKLAGKNEVLAKGITISSLVATLFLRYPAFCVVCPIGIVSRGMIHLKSIKAALAVKGTQLILWLETFTIPVLALFLSLKERRYWCRHLCPVGVFLSAIGAFNPFFKPRVDESKCIMYGCRKCEKVCPVDINLVEHGSLARCTKCLECTVVCDYDAITINFVGNIEAFNSFSHFCNRLRRSFKGG